MAILTIEHVSPDELPPTWRALLPDDMTTPMTIRIEAEGNAPEAVVPGDAPSLTTNPLFGMWQDRVDVALYARQIRAPRLGPDGMRNEG